VCVCVSVEVAIPRGPCGSHVVSLSGELAELKADLQSDKKEKKKEAVKKIIANMTVGKDVR